MIEQGRHLFGHLTNHALHLFDGDKHDRPLLIDHDHELISRLQAHTLTYVLGNHNLATLADNRRTHEMFLVVIWL